MSIGIRIGDQFLDLDGNTRINLRLINPLFEDQVGDNSHSLSFNIPNTPNNQAIFEHAEIVINYTHKKSYSGYLYFDGLVLYKILLTISKSSPFSPYSAKVDFNNARLAKLLGKESVKDLAYGGRRTISPAGETGEDRSAAMTSHANSTLASTWEDHDYVFPHFWNEQYVLENTSEAGRSPNGNLYLDTVPGLGGAQDFKSVVSNYNKPSSIPAYFNRFSLIPFPYLAYILKFMVEEAGFNHDPIDHFFADAELMTLCIFNPITLDEPLQEEIDGTDYIINHWKGYIELANHLPNMKRNDFMTAFFKLFNMAPITKNDSVSFVNKNKVLAKNEVEDWRDKALVNYYTKHEFYDGFVLSSTQDDDDLYSEDQVDMSGVSETVATLADLPTLTKQEVDTKYFVEDQNAVYIWRHVRSVSQNLADHYQWLFHGWRVHPIYVGSETYTTINSKASTTQVYHDPTDEFIIPAVNQEIYSELDEETESIPNFSLRLLFYRGFVDMGKGEFPRASSLAIQETDNYSLQWHGDKGLYKQWYDTWLDMLLQSKPFVQPIELDFLDLQKLDWTKKILTSTLEGDAKCYAKQIDVELSNNGLSIAQVEFVRI